MSSNFLITLFISFPSLTSYFLLFKTSFKSKFDEVNSAIRVNRVLCGSTRYLPNT